ncbi:MAG: zf-HC2 domain-containing protein [Armatimonadetes bacterium]|nr:zf-HC2 domain-containing protein [Armatimonadota bacterium]
MTCEEAVARLYEYLDRELDPGTRRRVRQHLARCRPCTDKVHFEAYFLAQLRRCLVSERAPASLYRRLEALVAAVRVK